MRAHAYQVGGRGQRVAMYSPFRRDRVVQDGCSLVLVSINCTRVLGDKLWDSIVIQHVFFFIVILRCCGDLGRAGVVLLFQSTWYNPAYHRCDRHNHYNDVIMKLMAFQITSVAIVYSTVYSGADQRKHQSSASLVFVWGIHRGLMNSPHKGPVTRKMFPVLMTSSCHD